MLLTVTVRHDEMSFFFSFYIQIIVKNRSLSGRNRSSRLPIQISVSSFPCSIFSCEEQLFSPLGRCCSILLLMEDGGMDELLLNFQRW